MTTPSPAYRPDIDGLRGIAVFCVVAFHAGLGGFAGGFVGVDIFFVISGYLICTIIEREIAEDRFSYAKFYARRARRILPALFAVLAACFATAALVLTAVEMQDFANSAVANIGAFSNLYFWRSANYFSPSSELKPLMMTWSLSVEEQFYLFFPPALLLLRRLRWRTGPALAALAALSLLASAWLTARNPTAAFFLLPTRAWELGVGALLAHYGARGLPPALLRGPAREALGGVGLLALLYAIVAFDHNTPFPGVAAAVPVFGTAMLIGAAGSAVNRVVLSNKALVFIGLVSYSWYLWHWPLLSFARLAADRPLPPATALTLAALAFVLAVLSWRFVERPFRAPGASDGATLRRYGAATALMLAVGVALVAGRGWQQRLPEQFASLERSGQVVPDPCLAPYGVSAPALGPACAGGAGGVALIGDSHAAALAPGLRALAAEHGLGYMQLTKASCPHLDGVTRRMPNHPGHDRECAAYNQAALARLRADPALTVVFVAGYWSAPFDDEDAGQRYVPAARPDAGVSPQASRRYLDEGLAATVRALAQAGKTVVLVKDVPRFPFDPVRAVAAEAIPWRKRLAAALGARPAGGAGQVRAADRRDPADATIDALAARAPRVAVLDPATALCADGPCRYSGHGHLYYVDAQHLSAAGARVALDQPGVAGLLAGGAAPRAARR
nr:acyltransferase family protein [uncultured Duganella sp.]